VGEQAGRGQRTFCGGSQHRIDVARPGMETRESETFLGRIVAETKVTHQIMTRCMLKKGFQSNRISQL